MDKKDKRLIELAAKGGNDASLVLLDLIHELEDKVNTLESSLRQDIADDKANQPDLNKVLDSIKGKDGHTPTDAELTALIVPLIPKVEDGEDGNDGEDGVTPTKEELLALIRPLIPEVKDGETPSDERLLALIEPLLPKMDIKEMCAEVEATIVVNMPKLGSAFRDGLELLQGEDRLDVSAIKGIDELKKSINDKIESLPKQVPARASNSMQFYDLSAQTNGTLKVFTVPTGLGAIVICSDFPTVLMEGNGFTLNATRTQITLAASLNAPSSGSQLLYQYISIENMPH